MSAARTTPPTVAPPAADLDGRAGTASPRRRRGGRTAAFVLGAAAAGAAVGLWTLLARDTGGESEAALPQTATAQIERRDLVGRETFEGTLGYAGARPLVSRLPGTITWLAPEGSVVRRGEPLLRVDGRGVFLMYGEVPAWRRLAEGAEGPDVRQLEWNLVALGHDPQRDVAIDGEFDPDTKAAVQRWQDARGVEEDGVVELGEVEFLPGARRVGAHEAALGSPSQPGMPVLETTSATQVVTVQLEADRRDAVAEGDAVEVELADGSTVAGRVTSIGKVAEAPAAAGEETAEAEPTVEVTIRLGAARATDLDQAPVEVGVVRESRQDVLVVPVTALLALASGGYAVEIPEGGETRLVRVEVGLAADGWVEISGDGLRAGTTVVVPK
jgi:multidrug efflux system membrane fusion protein